MLLSGQVRTGTADAALCDATIAAAAAQLPAMKLQDLTTLLFSLGKVCTWPQSRCVVARACVCACGDRCACLATISCITR